MFFRVFLQATGQLLYAVYVQRLYATTRHFTITRRAGQWSVHGHIQSHSPQRHSYQTALLLSQERRAVSEFS